MSPYLIISFSALLMLSAFLMGTRTRLNSLIRLFRFQSLVLAAALIAAAVVFREAHFVYMAVLLFALKVILIPSLLERVAKRTGVSGRLATFLRPSTMAFIAIVALAVGTYVAFHLPFADAALMVAAALSLALVGFELLIVHKNLFGQGIGFLVLENGIFFLGFALGFGMPLFIEIGVMLELLALLVIATALIARAHAAHRSVATDYMETLRDL